MLTANLHLRSLDPTFENRVAHTHQKKLSDKFYVSDYCNFLE